MSGEELPVVAMALDDTHLVWADSMGEVRVAAKDGGGPVLQLLDVMIDVNGVATDGEFVYVSHGQPAGDGPSQLRSVGRIPIDGGREVFLDPGHDAYQLNLDGDDVVYLDEHGAVRRVPKSGGPAKIVAGASADAVGLAVIDTGVYRLHGRCSGGIDGEDYACSSSVERVGDSTAPSAPGAIAPLTLAPCGAEVCYFTNLGSNQAAILATTGTSKQGLNAYGFTAFTADASNLYATYSSDSERDELQAEPLDGAAPVGLHFFADADVLAVDDQAIYLATHRPDVRITRVPK